MRFTGQSETDRKAMSLAMNLSLGIGLLMLFMKTGAYLLTGSAAILSDAAESVVHLAAVIAKDGTIQELHSLGGPALLIQAAMDAVKTWIYKPTMLNGEPVQVETTIDVNFTLNQ